MHARLGARMRHCLQERCRPLTIACVEIIDIRITQRTTCDSITADADTEYTDCNQSIAQCTKVIETCLATGPIILKISNSIASVTVGSSSPTYREAEGADATDGGGGLYEDAAAGGTEEASGTWGGTSGAGTGEEDILCFKSDFEWGVVTAL
jgi:hypothetical protein